MGALFDQETAKALNPELDAAAHSFWSGFLASDAKPIIEAAGQRRGGAPRPDDAQPVFLHFGTEGFRNAAELDSSKLVSSGDVMVSVNT
jgi:hypothetical protein